MKNATRVGLGAVALTLALWVGDARADLVFVYDFKFDAVGTYSAAEFMAQSPTLLSGLGQTATVIPPADLNGYSVPVVSVGGTFGANGLGFDGGSPFGSGGNAGDVIDFYFAVNGAAAGVGTYATTLAGRDISSGLGGSSYLYTTGSLTISTRDIPAAPEPSTVVMAVSALPVGLAVWLRRRKRTNLAVA